MNNDNFRNRIDTQRDVLEIINKYSWKEELFGLSEQAINRWKNSNNISSEIITIVIEISKNLFFLGVRSQEQITDEYSKLSSNITQNIDRLNKLLADNL
ncbi:hypothetical protein [Haemophilus haemolyticus]|uniref:hypothetical protein n=1 Tax=Haemophilus haemolyticus TaxID=726 RepID=UPI00112DEB33|nr:hypothetical protein [Haemophilus haemolyticus]TPH26341.1 hypothetical protein EUX56_05090 [Haemophilus haemolyticus]